MTGPHLSPEELAAYVDGQTNRLEWNWLVGHLATCDSCFRELVAIMRLIQDRPVERP